MVCFSLCFIFFIWEILAVLFTTVAADVHSNPSITRSGLSQPRSSSSSSATNTIYAVHASLPTHTAFVLSVLFDGALFTLDLIQLAGFENIGPNTRR